MLFHGTLIAAFFTKDEIFLASDGRVNNIDNGEVHDDWSKVHQINKSVGMLTAGACTPTLATDIINNCKSRGIETVDEVAKIAHLVLKEIWRLNVDMFEREGKLDDIRIFIFLAGFDAHSQPRLFYLDNMSDPIFTIQERNLFQTATDIEIAALSTGSGEEENPSAMLAADIRNNLSSNNAKQNSLPMALHSAFNSTKDRLSNRNSSIGGQTFFSRLSVSSGYQDISNAI